MHLILLAFFGLFLFMVIMYLVVKAAVNNSEQLKEIKVILMKAQNNRYGE